MRTMPTQMGSTAGNNGRTEGLPEVQKPVLEYTASEAQKEQMTAENVAQDSCAVNGTPDTSSVRIMDKVLPDVYCPCGCGNTIGYPIEEREDGWHILPITEAILQRLRTIPCLGTNS
jgi:hypothetical protein